MTRILIIDDEPTYREMVAHALAGMKYQIETAENGTKGISLTRAFRPDLIITDVVMPELTGYDVTRALRRDPDFARLPILVLSTQTGLQDKLKSFEAGADDYMTKPFEPAELVARVSILLRHADIAMLSAPSPVVKEVRSIAVHSLRGGTGSSSLAVNLGVGFANLWGSPTILIDLCMTAGQVAMMLDRPLKRTWADLTQYKTGELDQELISTLIYQHEGKLDFIAAPTFPSEAELIKSDTLAIALRFLKQKYDYIIADLPHDFSELTLQALDAADLILVVAAPEMASIRAMAAAMDTYQKLEYPLEKIKFILNATFPHSGLPKDKIEAALNIPVTAIIPYTMDLFVEAINKGIPVISSNPNAPVTGLLEDMAFLLSKDSDKLTRPANPTETWNRVYQRFNKNRK
jgi:pilus assembly protein CpaE